MENRKKSGLYFFLLYLLTSAFAFHFQIIDHTSESGHVLKRREGYWQHELMTFHPWGLNVRNELNGNAK